MIDQGGHASRATVFDGRGVPLANAVRAVGVRHPQPDWVEQDADDIVQSVRDALADAVGQLGGDGRRIRAAGLATQRSNIVCWDRETGVALSPAISWQDRRAQAWMRSFEDHRPQIRAITGLLPSAHYGVSKIHWCLEHLPAVQAARQRGTLVCGPLASFLLFRLLKDNPVLVDAVNASRTLLWDWRRRNWSDELLSLFGVTGDYLPQCVANRFPFGELEVVGLTIPLTVCTGDQSAALFTHGKPAAGNAYINIGTGAFMQCLISAEKVAPKKISPENLATENPAQASLLRSVVWNDGDQSIQVLEATVNGAGSALSAVAGELGLSLEAAQNQYAHWLATEKDVPLFLNGVSGLGSPFWVSQFASRFIESDSGDASAPAKMVAVLESIVFLLGLNLEEMARAGVVLQHITISGGLSVLDGLCQRLADISQLPVERAPQTEATMNGLAFLLIRPEQAWINEGKISHFVPQNNLALGERYQRWSDALLAAVKGTK